MKAYISGVNHRCVARQCRLLGVAGIRQRAADDVVERVSAESCVDKKRASWLQMREKIRLGGNSARRLPRQKDSQRAATVVWREARLTLRNEGEMELLLQDGVRKKESRACCRGNAQVGLGQVNAAS